MNNIFNRREAVASIISSFASISTANSKNFNLKKIRKKPFIVYFYANSLKYFSQDIDKKFIKDGELWEGVGTVYFRLPWCLLNPLENVYNWNLLRFNIDRFVNSGYKVAFRVSCSENRMIYSMATPQWVYEKGAKYLNFMSADVNDDGFKKIMYEPKFDDKIFMREHAKFLSEFRKFLRPYFEFIEFIDVGSLGVYGEGHTKSSTNFYYDEEVVFDHLSMNIIELGHDDVVLLANHNLADLVGGVRRVDMFERISQMNFGFRDDSIFVVPGKPYYDSLVAKRYFRDKVVVLETAEISKSILDNRWNDNVLLEALDEYGATHLGIHWYPSIFFDLKKKLVEKIIF